MSISIAFPGLRSGFPEKVLHRMEDGTEFELYGGESLGMDGLTPPHYVGPGTRYPLRMSLSEVAELFWRVRKYEVTHDLVFTASGWTSSGSGFAVAEVVAGSEIDLMKAFAQGLATGEAPGSGAWTRDSPAASGDVETSLYFEGALPLRYWDGSFWPYISMEFLYITQSPPAGDFRSSFYAASFAFDIGEGVASASSVPIDFFGREIPLYCTDSVTGTVEAAPSEWWEYGGKFDPDTGARA